jgi:hypothetical protein
MVKSNTTTRELGLIQRCEDICGLGATGITSNATLYSQFIGWLNQWQKTGASIAIMAWGGADYDDKAYTTKPSGTFAGTTNRDYNFDSSYKLLKIKLVQITYDGVNWVTAKAFDAADKPEIATHNPKIDLSFNPNYPKIDERADGFDLYPAFTAAQVTLLNSLLPDGNGGNRAVYVEWFRGPREWDTTTGTDAYEPALDIQFHHFPAVGASFEYCKLYKPDLAGSLQGDLYGARTARGQLIRTGMITDMENWYVAKNRLPAKLRMRRRVKI